MSKKLDALKKRIPHIESCIESKKAKILKNAPEFPMGRALDVIQSMGRYADGWKVLDSLGLRRDKNEGDGFYDSRYYYDFCDLVKYLAELPNIKREAEEQEKKENIQNLKDEKKRKDAERIASISCPALEDFLGRYRERLLVHFQNAMNDYENKTNLCPDYDFQERGVKSYINWKNAMIYKYGKGLVSLLPMDESRMIEMIENDVNYKREDFLFRIEEKAGKILDASELRVGNNGSINGWVKGEKKSVEVETILAGGYNIQCLHYRVLVKG
jgi:hypothetical protein